LYSNVDGGPDLLLFNEGDTSGTFTHTIYLSSFASTDRTMSAAEIQVLGGPSDLGIFVQTLPRLSITRESGSIRLNWQGSTGIRLQRSPALAPASWEDVPGSLGASTFTESSANGSAFYRLAR
jgi:hypothetical protein